MNESPTPRTIEVKPNMDFPDAIREVIAGKKIARMEWEDKQCYGFLKDGFLMINNVGLHQWILNDGDIMSDDWYVVN